MVIVDVQVEFKKVSITVPPLRATAPLMRALHGGFCATSNLSQQDLSRGATAELPIFAWRHFLRHLKYGFSFATKKDAAQSGSPVEGLFFRCNGVLYAEVVDIPGPDTYTAEVGEFDLAQPLIRVTDPSYRRNSHAVLVPGLTGTWRSKIVAVDSRSGYSISRMYIAHESVDISALIDGVPHAWQPQGHVDVDSGQCACFDDARYPDDPRAQDDLIYDVYCDATSCTSDLVPPDTLTRVEPASALSDRSGVVSKTFHGDGTYDVRAIKNAEGLALAIEIQFNYVSLEEVEK